MIAFIIYMISIPLMGLFVYPLMVRIMPLTMVRVLYTNPTPSELAMSKAEARAELMGGQVDIWKIALWWWLFLIIGFVTLCSWKFKPLYTSISSASYAHYKKLAELIAGVKS